MRFSTTGPLALLTSLLAHNVSAASNMVPDYEVKLLMNATAVLDPTKSYKLKPSVLSAFSMPTTVTKMNVQFLDTNTKQIYNAGWSPRIRKTEGESGFELTYKKRYPVSGSDINAALTTANSEGFDSTDTDWDAQIEWGYSQKTLSISRKKSATKSGYSGMDLPNTSDSRSMLIDKAPGTFEDWGGVNNWGTDLLDVSRIYGPVLAKRSIGTWSGIEVYIEVWPIKDVAGTGIEYIVEASFKTGSVSVAGTKSGDLQTFLEGQGWFLAGDSLKTGLIMDRY
ncbi:hypothetical protein QBC37DRAFT_423535 [Rhypophila decipiens]|uniref:Uncharacterized protein n=1 Tax=Rhypophila decipiens TaxID=261697 RepID=A0AAN6YAT5_9PEZI|nr:hypothetical protein QBC37DRAFT_423535 [Rhypophila decipiens]